MIRIYGSQTETMIILAAGFLWRRGADWTLEDGLHNRGQSRGSFVLFLGSTLKRVLLLHVQLQTWPVAVLLPRILLMLFPPAAPCKVVR